MAAIISLLRGVNLGGHHKIKMDELRTLYVSLGLRDVQTYINSGNVIFRSQARGLDPLRKRIEKGIEQRFGFHAAVVMRTCSELRETIARGPFAARTGFEPSKHLVVFLAGDPSPDARNKALGIEADPEEMRISGRELHIYFPNGMGRSKLSVARLEKALETSGTGRNWNTVMKLLELAERIEAGN